MIQEPNAIIDPSERVTDPAVRTALEARAMSALQAVLDNGAKIELDHHLVYYARTSCLSSLSFPFPFYSRPFLSVSPFYLLLLSSLLPLSSPSSSLHLSPFLPYSILYTKKIPIVN